MQRTAMLVASILAVLIPSLRVSAQPASTPVRVTFEAQSPEFGEAARAYERIWESDGSRIVAAMERRSTLRFIYPQFADTAIRALILERPSSSGYRNLSPMELRASYPDDTKRATLVHELGHRLMGGLFRRNEEEHEALFLWVYDVWIDLYGQRFADEQVAVEKLRRGPYPQAWDAVTALSAEERARRWQSILSERLPRRL